MNCCEQNMPYGCNEGRDCPVRQSTVDGGHQVNGSLSFPLHRQVMPPQTEDSDAGYWAMFGIGLAAVICFVLAVAHFARYQF